LAVEGAIPSPTILVSNKYWTFTQEVLVLIHGTTVAIVNGNNLWPMFFFGFGGIFVITQMYGLNLKSWAKWTLLALYIVGAVLVYAGVGPTVSGN
jgi:hypothetical protein